MTSDWDEIKRLAADFQKVQLSSTLQKLSETNCIEVVNLLVEKGLISVIYTIDGKEYITPDHLRKEVEDELYVHGGRVNLVELAKTLNVDLSRINTIAEQMAKENADIHFILGQLMNEDYVRNIAAEINDNLSQKGEISVFELASGHFDLPTEFLLHNVMEKYLGTIILARQDQDDNTKFFTQKYISRCKAKLRGAMAGLTMPTPVASFFANIGGQEAMYHSLISELKPDGVVTSKQKGALYVPHVFTKTQTDWVESFYQQNGYLEYDAVARLGVTSPNNFIKRLLPKEKCTYLSKCCVDQRIISQIESGLEECIATQSFLDASSILPSVMVEEDIVEILAVVLKPNKLRSTKVFGTTIITTSFLEELIKPIEEIIVNNANKSVSLGLYQKYIFATQIGPNKSHDNDVDEHKYDRKDDRRRKAAGGKGGGGTQGRETKTKSTKKHYRGGDKNRQSDSEDDDLLQNKQKNQPKLELLTHKEIEQVIKEKLESEGLDYLIEDLVQYYYPQYSQAALLKAKSVYEISLQAASQTRRQTHPALQDKFNNALVDIRLYEKGLKLLPVAVQPQLVKYLLKTLGNDICNDLFSYAANESNLGYEDSALTPEQKVKILQDCNQGYKAPLTALNKAIAGSSIEEFLTASEAALQSCSMILKKIDKKKDRTLVLCHKHSLLEKLENCTDPALILHLAVLLIFTISSQTILHASGKHISSVLSYLQPVLDEHERITLQKFHDCVLNLLSTSEDSNESKIILDSLEYLIQLVKAVATDYKRVGTATE